MKWILELKNRLFKKKTGENEENAVGNRILDALKMLKNQCIGVLNVIGNLQVVSFIKEKWYGGVDYYDLFLFYSDLNLDRINKIVKEYYEILPKYEECSVDFKSTKHILKQAKIDKSNIDLYEIDIESKELDKQSVSLEQRKKNIENWVTTMGYKKKNLIIGLDKDCDHLLALEYFKGNPRSIIIYILLCLIVGGIYWIEYYQYGFYSLLFVIGVVTWLYYELLKTISLKAVKKYVKANKELEAIIREDYRKAYNIIKSYGKEKNLEEPPKIISREALEDRREEPKAISREELEDLKPSPVQQPIEKELYNPNKKEWQEIFEQFFKNHNFKVPEFEKLETTEVHIFSIPTISIADFSGKQEQIENFIGKRIYKIHKEYEGIGKIGVEFETVELQRIISYDEVPQPKNKNEIVLGKGIKQWISLDINSSPHTLVVGATGGGKSVTMNFLISQVVKKRWLPYFVDFKGGIEFSIYKNNGYTVITEREAFVQFTKGLYGEVKYRSKLLSEYRVKNLDDINKKLKADNKAILPRIMVFLDEYADVNSVKDEFSDIVNSNIGRVLAKSRAVGINMVLGTQRPDAKTIGEGAFRDNIACRLVGKMNSDSAYAMSFGTSTLTKEDKIYVNKMPDDDRSKGMFIVQGTGTINDKEIIKVPFMKDEEFEDMVLNEWEDNPYANYKLHYEEDNEAEEYVEKPVPKVDIQKLKKYSEKYSKDNVVEIQEEYDTHSTDFDINDFIDL